MSHISLRDRERFREGWLPVPPDTALLTDTDVTQFVEGVKGVVYLAMFNKTGSNDAASALQHLAVLRPELVIPPLLDRYVSC